MDKIALAALMDAIERAVNLVLKLRDLAKQVGATDAELDAMDARLTEAHARHQNGA